MYKSGIAEQYMVQVYRLIMRCSTPSQCRTHAGSLRALRTMSHSVHAYVYKESVCTLAHMYMYSPV